MPVSARFSMCPFIYVRSQPVQHSRDCGTGAVPRGKKQGRTGGGKGAAPYPQEGKPPRTGAPNQASPPSAAEGAVKGAEPSWYSHPSPFRKGGLPTISKSAYVYDKHADGGYQQ